MKRPQPRDPVAAPNLARAHRSAQHQASGNHSSHPGAPTRVCTAKRALHGQAPAHRSATIVRIVRGLGFASYREFQHHLHELSLAFASPLDTLQPAGRDSSMPAFVLDSLAQDLKNLHGLKNSVDAQRLADLAKRFYNARRILLFAGDIAAVLVDYLDYQISALGLPIFAVTSAGAITHSARAANKRDLVIAISFRRGLRQTVEGAQQAREHGAYCVGISDTYLSPLARECDELFLASVESTSYRISFAAPISLLNAHYRCLRAIPPPLNPGRCQGNRRRTAQRLPLVQPVSLLCRNKQP